MNRKIIIRSIIIALLLATVLTVIGDFLFTRRAAYSMKTDEWQKMESMNYKDAMEYMNQHKIETSPVRNFIEERETQGHFPYSLHIDHNKAASPEVQRAKVP